MRFIDHQQMCMRQIHALPIHGARPQRLNGSDLHKFERSGREARLNDPMRDAGSVKLAACLLDDFAAMCQHQHWFQRARRGADDLGADDGFARACWCYQYDAVVTFIDTTMKFIDNIALILAEL